MKQTEETQRAKKGMETDMAAMKNKLSFANNILRQVMSTYLSKSHAAIWVVLMSTLLVIVF